MNDTLVLVTNPRAIPECMEAFAALRTHVAYVRGMADPAAMAACNEVIDAAAEFTNVLVCADDCIVTQAAVDAVVELLDGGHPVATGYCNLDRAHPLVNLSTTPLVDDAPSQGAYTFPSLAQVAGWPLRDYPTYFVGMSLTGMSRDMWRRFPLGCYTNRAGAGWSSDYHLSLRLNRAGVPMVAARDGWVDHVKEVWMRADRAPEKRLLVGEIPAEVVWQCA